MAGTYGGGTYGSVGTDGSGDHYCGERSAGIFPALASTFAYVFTMDGYMLALFLAVLAVLFTAKYPRGYLTGAVCLAFSMGIYQAYLPFTILLCVYKILLFFMEEKGWEKRQNMYAVIWGWELPAEYCIM